MKTICHGSAPPRALPVFILVLTLALRLAGANPDIGPLRAKAEEGNSVAQYYLGLVYAEGRAVPKDLVEAYVWLSLAAENGSNGIPLGMLMAEMSPDQLAAARFRLDERRRTTPSVVSVPRAEGLAASSGDQPAALEREIAGFRLDQAKLSDELAAAWKEEDGAKKATAAAEQRARQAEADLSAARTRNTELVAANQKLEEQARAAAGQIDAAAQAKAALATAEQRAREAEAGVAALQRERDEQAKSLAAAQTAAAGLTAQIKKLSDDKTALAQANSRLEDQVQTSTRQAEQADRAAKATVADQGQKLAAQTTELAAARTELVTAQGAQADLATQLKKLADEKALLTRQAARSGEAGQEAAGLKTKLVQAESNLSAARTRNTELVAANQKLEEQARATAGQIDAAAQAKAALATAEQRAREAEAGVAALQRERDEQAKSLAAAQTAAAGLTAQIKKLSDDKTALAQANSRLEDQVQTSTRQAEQADRAAKATVADQGQKLAAQTTELAAARTELVTAQGAQADLATQLKKLADEKALLTRQAARSGERDQNLAGLKTDLQNARRMLKDLDAAQAAVAQTTAIAEQNRRERDDLRQQLEAANRNLAAAQTAAAGRVGENARQLAELQLQLQQAKKEMAELDSQNQLLHEASQRLESQHKETADAVRQLAEAQNAIEQLKHENASLEAQHAALTARLAEGAPAAASTGVDSADEVAHLKEKLRRAESEVEMTVRSFTLARQENERLKVQIKQAGAPAAENHDAEAALASARQELSTVRAAADKAAADSAALRDALHQAQDAYAKLATEYARLKTEVPQTGVNLPAGSGTPSGQPAMMAVSVVPPPAISLHPPAPAPRTHRVVAGDTLRQISNQYYGTTSRWQDIYNANRDTLRSADVLPLDVELRIP